MPQPDLRAMIVAGPLQNFSVMAFKNNFIGEKIFPIVNVDSEKATIGKVLKGAWFRNDAKVRAEGTRAARGGYPLTTVSINAIEYARAVEVTDETRRRAKLANTPPLRPDQMALQFAATKIDLNKEILIATDVKGWANSEDVEGGWAYNAGTNTFEYDINYRMDYIESITGFRPNGLMISSNTWMHIKMISGFKDNIRYTEGGKVTPNTIKGFFDLEEVIIGGSIQNTAKETISGTEFTASRLWETNAGKGGAFLYYKYPQIGLDVPTVGIQARVKYESGQVRQTLKWRETAEHQDVYEVDEMTDIVATATDLGHYFYDTIST